MANYTEAQKKMMELLHLEETDFEPKETTVTDEERINDLEIAICEIVDALYGLEE